MLNVGDKVTVAIQYSKPFTAVVYKINKNGNVQFKSEVTHGICTTDAKYVTKLGE